MRPSTRHALTISLCLHAIAALIVALFVVRQQFEEKFEDMFAVELFSMPRMPAPPLKMKIDPVIGSHRQQLVRTPRVISPKSQPPNQTEHFLNRASTVNLDQPRHLLDTTPIDQTARTDLSTAVRDLRADTTALPQTEAAPSPGMGSRGLKTSGTPGVHRAQRDSLLETLQEGMGGDTVAGQSNLPGPANPTAPQIGFDEVMAGLAEQIIANSDGGPIDVVFVIDASGSMGDNIRAVARHLIDMIEVYESAKVDYALGLTEFWAPGKPKRNEIKVLQLTKNMYEYKQDIQRITPRQDENAIDAIDQTVREIRFRPTSQKHLIVVTDEPFTSLKNLSLDDVIALCREFDLHVNVLGLNNDEHKKLAEETGGVWHAIPQDQTKPRQRRMAQSSRSRSHARALRHARWTGVAEIGKVSLKNLVYNSLDVILFIDGSKSMEDKLPEFLKQLEGLIRDWDNALIDYQIGVVRFRAGTGTFNYVNVFQPPQTLDDIRKIVSLPCQGNENLLDAIVEGIQKINFRPTAQSYFILVTDEPSTGGYSPQAVLQFCLEAGAKVGVIGTFDSFQQQVALETDGVWVPIPDGKTTNSLNW